VFVTSESKPAGRVQVKFISAAGNASRINLLHHLARKVTAPLMAMPFALRFGMTTDKYGTPWIVTTLQAASG
jgi:uncharacterized glyoxalase superfamily protein PhnB